MSTTATFLPALARWETTPVRRRQPSGLLLQPEHIRIPERKEKHTLNPRIEKRNIALRISARARNNLRNQHRRPQPLGGHHVHQLAQALVRGLPAVRVAVVRPGVQEDGAGGPAYVRHCAGDLVDRPARVAFVVFVRESAAAHAADVVDFGAGVG